MGDSDDPDVVVQHDEHHDVRKPSHGRTASAGIRRVDRKRFGCLGNAKERGVDARQELRAETRALIVVPLDGSEELLARVVVEEDHAD
jgi:hypothetical protein